MKKTISIFGSTGVIGSKALDLAQKFGYKIKALIANKNYKKIIDQANIYHPEIIGIADNETFAKVKETLNTSDIKIYPKSELNNLATIDIDCLIMAISGTASIESTFSCLGHAKRLAIASKEAIIAGGMLLQTIAKGKGTEIIPVDSEHSSVFQCLRGELPKDIEQLILTASGGSFIDYEESDLTNISVSDALQHPNWNMGYKNTIDSSTLINKALEIIEASYLFNIEIEKVKAIIHPQSIIHAFVKFCDNSYKSLMYTPDMNHPIAYAMKYPERSNNVVKDLDLLNLSDLRFQKMKPWQKRNIDLAYHAYNEKKVISFNSANEIAVNLFIKKRISFCDIYNTISLCLECARTENPNSVEDIINISNEAKHVISSGSALFDI